MPDRLGTEARPMRVAVVGSGPSGFYAAEALFKAPEIVRIDMFERLPVPFGLVRYGVAPDHAKIKNVIKVYERCAQNENFSFLGNVTVGRDITTEELRQHYDALVFACGAETDRRLGIPGEDLPGSYTATEFVAWYNGHPDYRDRTFDLSCAVAVIIGQGNVAVDVCRILAKTVDELKHTDISARALDALAESNIREIHMIGRRGPAQTAFTPQEIKEFADLEECDPVVDPAQLELGPVCAAELEDPERRDKKKNYATLMEFAARPTSAKSRRFVIHFFESPKELDGAGRLERVTFERNKLVGEPGQQKASGTGETFVLECGALFRSVGYRGLPIAGVPFDERSGVFPNRGGRIEMNGGPIPGLYAVGWIKRGPSGIIGTNKPDSIETAKNLLSDMPMLAPCPQPETNAVLDLLSARGVKVVSYEAWQRIDAAEIERGKPIGKPREKYASVDELLSAAGL
jgi:ferredoxin--NADP+ reductase